MPDNPPQKKLTLQDIADKFLELETQIVTFRKAIQGLEEQKAQLFLTVCQKVDELSGPQNRAQRRAEQKKQKKIKQ